MILDLDRSRQGRFSLVISHQLEVESADDSARGIKLDGELKVDNLRNRLILTGELTGEIRASCDRCLESFELDFDVPVEILILRDTEQEGDEDTCVIHQRSGEVHLEGPLGELALLAVPQKKVCNEDCRGLCPQCGINLNRDTCNCSDEAEDPRWDGLPDD